MPEVEEVTVDGKLVTRNVDLDPAIPRPGESPSDHAFRNMKTIIDDLHGDGQRPARIASAVRFLRDMDPAHQHEAERYIREKTGMTIGASSRASRPSASGCAEMAGRPQAPWLTSPGRMCERIDAG